jgi:hypothetical protein
MGSVEFDEREHDRQGVDIEPYLKQAMDDLVYDLFAGEKVDHFDLHDFLERRSPWIGGENMRELIEKELRKWLEDSDALYERAERLAQGEE